MIASSFNDQISYLSSRLNGTLPGIKAHIDMAPAFRQQQNQIRVEGKSCREAAVLALLFPIEGSAGILLTKRRENLKKHAGQISFPGGKREINESLQETALRETAEEVGIFPNQFNVLGPMSPLYINVSNFCVYPFLGYTEKLPDTLLPQDDEVERILKVPLSLLGDPSSAQKTWWNLRGQKTLIPHFQFEGETIWGATAMMLSELLHLFKP